MDNKKIIIENAEQCMEILNAILNNSYPQKKLKYASYLSMNYFVKNLNFFSKEYIEKILSHETLGLNISAKFSYELLENAVQNKTVFPAYSKKWFNNIKSNQELLEKYLVILVDSQDNQQIEDFCQINPILSKNYYLSQYPDNYMFEKCVIANNPTMIVNKKQLKEEDLIDLLEKGLLKYEHVKRIFPQFSNKVQVLFTRNEIEFILNYHVDKTNKEDLIDLISPNTLFFIKKIQDINSDFSKKLLMSSGAVLKQEGPNVQLNMLQSLVIENLNKEDKLKEIMALSLYAYKDILMKDVTCILGTMNYEYKMPFLIHSYGKIYFNLFSAMAYFNDCLDKEEKDIVLTANFDNLLQSYEYKEKFPQFNFEINKYIAPLTYFRHEELSQKIELLKTKHNIPASLVLEVEKYLLHNKLTEKLIEKNTQEKRMKI